MSDQFQIDPEPAVLVETEDHQLFRYPAGTTRLPAGSIAWINPAQWAQNCDEKMWKRYLLSSQPELCNVDDVRAHSQQWKLQHIWPALLAVAKVPPADSSSPDPDKEADMAKNGKAKTKKVKAAATGNGRGRKSNIDPSKKIVFAEGFKLREGTATAARFAEVRSGVTVKTALEKGLTAADINWHLKKGNLSLEG